MKKIRRAIGTCLRGENVVEKEARALWLYCALLPLLNFWGEGDRLARLVLGEEALHTLHLIACHATSRLGRDAETLMRSAWGGFHLEGDLETPMPWPKASTSFMPRLRVFA